MEPASTSKCIADNFAHFSDIETRIEIRCNVY